MKKFITILILMSLQSAYAESEASYGQSEGQQSCIGIACYYQKQEMEQKQKDAQQEQARIQQIQMQEQVLDGVQNLKDQLHQIEERQSQVADEQAQQIERMTPKNKTKD